MLCNIRCVKTISFLKAKSSCKVIGHQIPTIRVSEAGVMIIITITIGISVVFNIISSAKKKKKRKEKKRKLYKSNKF
jgi:uncharacterized protein (DUF983 family)